jgi:signal transduction histidine kinase
MPQTAPKDLRIIRVLKSSPAIAALVAFTVSTLVLLDWAVPGELRHLLQPGEFPILPTGAVALMLVSASMWLQRSRTPERGQSTLAQALAAAALAICLISIIEWIADIDVRLDTLFFQGALRAHGLSNGRMPLNTAIVLSFECAGLLSLKHDRNNNRYKAQMFAFAGLLVSIVALAGYIFGVPQLYSLAPGSGMAMPMSVLNVLLCFGVLMAWPERGLPAIIVDEGAAGILARRMIPAAVVIPLLFGWLRLRGERLGYVTLPFGVSMYAVADMVAIVAIVGWSARVVRRTDLERNRLLVSEQHARESAELARSEAEHARLEAERANSAKSEFLAVMSHELRTPLTAIIGYEELLSDGITGPVTDPQKTQLGRIKASAGHLLELIDQILTFSRVEVGREQVSVSDGELTDLLRAAAQIVEPMVAAKKISLTVNLPDTPVRMHTDMGKVRQIVINLLGNAVKFTDRGGITLRAEQKNGTVAVDVIDTGIGIPSEFFDQVFEPFWQVEQPITRTVGGTGLGLSVSRRLARLLGGDIKVSSTVGEGSHFTVVFPVNYPGNKSSRSVS